jgi:hypothetical protein
MARPSKITKLYSPGQKSLVPLSRSQVELFQQCKRPERDPDCPYCSYAAKESEVL